MLNPTLDFPGYWKTFVTTGRVQVPNFLQLEIAEQLHACLQTRIGWSVAIRDNGVSQTLPDLKLGDPAETCYQEMIAKAVRHAFRHYGFIYESYMMIKAYREGRDLDIPLHRMLEYMNGEPFLDFCRSVSGNAGVRRVSAQATRFRPGMFLREHDDQDDAEGRVVAYVVNLSKHWQADWGGLLQFIDSNGLVTETYLPRFNSLSLFRVPTKHCVSMISPWAGEPRLSITGWWETLPAM